MTLTEQVKFEGFTETPVDVVKRDYNVLSGELADAGLKRVTCVFNEQFSGFPGLEGTLKLVNARGRRELAGSNMPVLAALNLVDFSDLGIQVCDERDLAMICNDEVQRLALRKEGFFSGKYWFDAALIRNPHALQKELAFWEQELNKEVSELYGAKEIVSVPYRAIVPVVSNIDNSPFGKMGGYLFKINPDVKDALSVIEVGANEAQNGYDFCRLSRNRRFSRLFVYGGLSAVYGEDPLDSNVDGRVVFKSAA